MYTILFTERAAADMRKLYPRDYGKTQSILALLRQGPYQMTYEKLVGPLEGACSRRVNCHKRLIYTVDDAKKAVKIICIYDTMEGKDPEKQNDKIK